MIGRLLSVTLLLTLLFAGSLCFAGAMGTTNANLTFKLGVDSAYIQYTVLTTDSTLATVPFSLRLSDSTYQSRTVADIFVGFTYDGAKLIVESAVKDSGNWAGSITLTTSSIGGTMRKALLELHNGTAGVPVSVLRNYFYLKIRPVCQTVTNTDSLIFTASTSENQIHLTPDNPGYWFSPGTIVNGAVKIKNLRGSFTLPNVTSGGKVGSQDSLISLSCTSTTNFPVYYIEHWITYNHNHFQVVSVDYSEAPWSLYPDYDLSRTDTVVINCVAIGGIDTAFNNGSLYKLSIRALCPSATTGNYLDSFKFVPGRSIVKSYACTSQDPIATYTSGGIRIADSAKFFGDFTYAPALSLSTSGDSARFRVKMINTFTAGIRTGHTSDTGVVVDVKSGNPAIYLPNNPKIDSTFGRKFVAYAVGGQQTEYNHLFQRDSTVLSIPAASTPATMLTFKMLWDPSSYGTPHWNSRYIKPSFVSADNSGFKRAGVPDLNNCRRADTVNGLLQLQPFGDSLKVLMGEYSMYGHASSSPCTWQDLYIRSNFTLDSFYLRVTVGGTGCLTGFSSSLAGVSYTQVSSSVYDIYATAAFDSLPASDTIIKIGRISEGIQTASCMPMGKAQSVGVVISLQKVWSRTDGQKREEFAAIGTTGGSSGRCPNGNGCCYIEQEPDPNNPNMKRTDESGLPTVFALHQNFPNPFNPNTMISFDLPVASAWRIEIFNINGQSVKVFEGESGAGTSQVEWNASSAPSGVYLYRFSAGNFVETRKMVLLK
jgi:hypothetical protein